MNRPAYVNGELCLPKEETTEWALIFRCPISVVVKLEWKSADTLGWVTEWAFFNNEQEIPWDEVQDQIGVAMAYYKWSLPHVDDVVPWGEDIEVLVVLGRL